MPAGAGRALLSAALFGISAPLAKSLLGAVPPQLLAGLFYLGSGAGLTLVLLLRRGRRLSGGWPHRREWPALAGAVVAGGVLGPVLLLRGLDRTPSSTAALLLNLEAVFTSLLAWAVFREHVGARIAAGMALIVGGGVALSWHGRLDPGASAGAWLVAAACLCWAADNNLTRTVSGADPVRLAAIKGWVAGAVNTGLALTTGAGVARAGLVVPALAVGFVSYGLSLVLFITALRRLGAARTGAYFSTAPFIGAAVAVVTLGDPVTAALGGAGLLMAAGVWLHLTEHHEHPHAHDSMVHAHVHVHDAHHRHAHRKGDPPGEPHLHRHRHGPLVHAHPHAPDPHHRHAHARGRTAA